MSQNSHPLVYCRCPIFHINYIMFMVKKRTLNFFVCYGHDMPEILGMENSGHWCSVPIIFFYLVFTTIYVFRVSLSQARALDMNLTSPTNIIFILILTTLYTWANLCSAMSHIDTDRSLRLITWAFYTLHFNPPIATGMLIIPLCNFNLFCKHVLHSFFFKS